MQIGELIRRKECFFSMSSIDYRRCISISLESCVHLMVWLVHQCYIWGITVIDADWYCFLYVHMQLILVSTKRLNDLWFWFHHCYCLLVTEEG